jgi:hypothetical protein
LRTRSLKKALATVGKTGENPGRIWIALKLQIAVGSIGESPLLFLVKYFAVIRDRKKFKGGFFRLPTIMLFFEGLTNIIKQVYYL